LDFDAKEQLLILYSAFLKYLKKLLYNESVHHLFIDFKKVYDLIRREVLYNILIEFVYPHEIGKADKIVSG
jgi:hypothetical protein